MEAEPSPAAADAPAAAAEPAAAEPAAVPAPAPNADAEIDPKKLKRWRVEELRAALEAVGASTEGHKPALVERLVAARTGGGAMEEDAAAPAEPAPAPAADAEPAAEPEPEPA